MNVTIENPAPGKSATVAAHVAAGLINKGSAIATARCGNQVLIIRMLNYSPQSLRQMSNLGYDEVDRVFDKELAEVPVVQGQKMIRQEKSSRNWSYTESVRRSARRAHDASEVSGIRAAQPSCGPITLPKATVYQGGQERRRA